MGHLYPHLLRHATASLPHTERSVEGEASDDAVDLAESRAASLPWTSTRRGRRHGLDACLQRRL